MIEAFFKKTRKIFGTEPLDSSNLRKVSSFLDKKVIESLQPIINDLRDFDPGMSNILNEGKGVRRWEYGMLLHCLPSMKDKQVLDVGSGPSTLPLFLSKKEGAHVTVLDLPQPYTIEISQMERRFSEENITLKTGDMRSMPFENNAFDYVISVSVIEHLSHSADHKNFAPRSIFISDTKKTLTEMYRVLRPGGWVYLTSDAYIPGRVKNDLWAKRLLDGNPYGAYPVDELEEVFVTTFLDLGALLPFPINYDKSLLISSSRYSSYRDRYMTVFNLFVQKP